MKFAAAAAVAIAAGGLVLPVGATVLVPRFTSCLDTYSNLADVDDQLNITSVFASLVPGAYARKQNLNGGGNDVLRLNLFGTVNHQLDEYNMTSSKLSWEAGVKQWDSTSRLCTSIYPSNVTDYTPGMLYCPIPAGDFGMNVSIPLYNIHELATLQTQIHVVDNAEPARTIACVEVHVTPYIEYSWPYLLFLWFPIALAMGYWVTTWAARFAAGWVVGVSRSSMARREAAMLKWGTMIISGLSGERFGVSTALLRFVTPGLRDIMFHIQFVTMLGMVSINWPSFFYPIVSQSAWADLLWNVSIVSSDHQTLYPSPNITTPVPFGKQMGNPTHPLFLNSTGEDRLIDLQSTPDGMLSFAKSVGLRPQDLFGTCLVVFLMLTGGIVVVHMLLWFCHWITELASPDTNRPPRNTPQPVKVVNQSRASLGGDKYGAHSRSSSNGKEWFDNGGVLRTSSGDLNGMALSSPQTTRATKLTTRSRFHRIWKRFAFRGEAGAFHFSALYGNLLRLIITFHFPITAFSAYQLTLGNSSIAARVLAAIALAVISVLIPAGIMYKISRTPTGKLYDAARTLLALGTVYNVYEPEKQLYRTLPMLASLIQGVAIGAGQKNGLAQTIVLAVVELVCFVATTVWSPWGEGAGMGGHVVFISILRIASIIMAMVLCHQINIEESAQQWITYSILILQALIFVFFFFMLITKIIEGLIRLFGGAPFDESKHPMDGGIFAAIMDLDCFNGVRGGKAAARKKRKRDSRALQRNVSQAGSLTTQMMLDRHSQGVERHAYPLVEQRRGSYHPVPRNTSYDQFGRAEYGHRPSLSDQGSLQSERMTDESYGRILDGWKPTMYDAQPPQTPSDESTNMKRQSWGGGPPPAIRVIDENTLQQHSRARSSSAIIEELISDGSVSPPLRSLSTSPRDYGTDGFGAPTGGYPPQRLQGDRERALRPPPLSIPRRRSLNNINIDDDPDRARGKRRSWGSSAWLVRTGRPIRAAHDDSESDDETHSHDRRTGASDPYDDPAHPRGWRAIFSRRRNVMDERTRGEKLARKARAVNESGAAFAGVPAPVAPGARRGGFRVHRKLQSSSSADALTAMQGSASTSASTTPLLVPPTANAMFRVHRGGMQQQITPPGSSPASMPPSPAIDSPMVPESSSPSAGPSFRVTRKGHSPSGSSISSPQALATVPEPGEPPINAGGYSADLFRPLNANHGRVSANYGHASNANNGQRPRAPLSQSRAPPSESQPLAQPQSTPRYSYNSYGAGTAL